MTESSSPNYRRGGRVRVYDSADIAAQLRETFTKKPVTAEEDMPFGWPRRFRHVGDSLAVAYASDKWKKDGDYELYKHIAESRNQVLCEPGFLRDFDDTSVTWKTVGPTVDFAQVPMPKHFAPLGFFEEADLCLFTRGTDEDPRFGKRKNDGVVKVTLRHGILGGSKMRWSLVPGGRKDQPFLFVYTEPRSDDRGGVKLIIVGDELDIEEDGIVG